MKRENKGITLIALVITVTVLIILASIATYSGVEIIRQSKLNKFTTEMKVMQTEINALYDRYTSGETDLVNLGKELDSQADKVFTSGESGITDKTGYRYYDQATIQSLGIEDIEEEFFVNIQKRSVVSYLGLEYEGTTYYTLDKLPQGLYNVDYEDKNTGKPTFDVTGDVDDDKYTITVSNIQYDGYIEKWQVKYQKEGQDYWSTSEDLSFRVGAKGTYSVKVVNGNVESEIKQVEIGFGAEENYTYTDENGDTAEIPKGFEVSDEDGEKTVDEGLVIKDEVGNEFVWIPVTNSSSYVLNKTYPGLSDDVILDTGYLPDGIQPTVDNASNNEIAERNTVLNAGGFYISRYEAGNEGGNLVSKKGANIRIDVSKNEAKKIAKNFINNSSVKSAMCSGIQWDVVMETVNNKYDGKEQVFNVLTARDERHTGNATVSGNNEADRVYNIYDLESNYWEYVAETNSNGSSKIRGGAANDKVGAATRSQLLGSDGTEIVDAGFRVVLYVIK